MRLLSRKPAADKAKAKPRTPAAPRRLRPVSPWRGRIIRLSLAALVIIAIGGAIGWSVRSGQVARTWAAVSTGAMRLTADAGLKISDVLVAGRDRTDKDALLEKVGVQRGTPILGIDLAATRARVLSLPWVKDARVERRLPDMLHVTLVERQPMALWQRGRDFTVVDQDGVEIAGQDVRRFHDLPIVIGENAPTQTATALAMLDGEPDLRARVRVLTLVGGRRWTVRLDNGIDVQLPEVDPARAWTQLAALARDHGVLERDVVTIDLRIPDQLIMRVTPAAQERATAPGKNT